MTRETPTQPSGAFVPDPSWPSVPAPTSFGGDAAAVAVNKSDEVIVFNRGPIPVLIFDRSANLITGWGAGEFDSPHGMSVDVDGNLLLVDDKGHTVEKRSPSGELLLRIGVRGRPAEWNSGDFFNRPTDAVSHPATGEIFVTDGYGNNRIHRFAGDGTHLLSWGSSGGDLGLFHTPHGLCLLPDDTLAVCDRENWRVQVFTLDGAFLRSWWSHRPMAIESHDGLLYIAEGGPTSGARTLPNLGRRICIHDLEGNLLDRFGAAEGGTGLGQFYAPHGVAVDSRGDVYVAEVTASFMVKYYNEPAPDSEPKSLSRWLKPAQR